ncbi:MAG: amidohydrolase family protein [Vicinamibacterales bacterium]
MSSSRAVHRMLRSLLALIAAAATSASLMTPAGARTVEGTATFRLHLLAHEIGREVVTTSETASGRHLASNFHFDDRGAAVDLTAGLDLSPDGNPLRLVVKGKTYRYFSSDTEVTRSADRVQVRDNGANRTVAVAGQPFFPLDGYAPIGVQEVLIRYWFAHGRPAEIVAPPAGVVRIAVRGLTVIDAPVVASSGNPSGLALAATGGGDRWRLSIDGALWGTETAWFDTRTDQLIALTTWAGALPFEAIRDGYESQRDRFIAEAVADRIADLEALTRRTPPLHSSTFALVGATIVDGTDAAAIPHGTVLVREGRIAAVGAAAAVTVPRETTIVDVRGTTIVPGLWDMHAHASQVDWAPVYLASGVTTIRDMGGEQAFLTAFRDAIASGRGLGPRLLLAGLIDGPGPRAFGTRWAATPEEGGAAVRALKAAGFQEAKIYTLVAPEVVTRIAAVAHQEGMMVTGHIPTGMDVRQAVEAGYDQIAHMPISGQPGSDAVKDLIAFFVAHHTVIDPTSSWNELLQHAPATPIAAFQPGVQRLPAPLARMILSTPGGTAEPAAARARLLQSLRLVNDARAAGVPVVAGTDKGVPGFSVQREIELYVDGGMTPLQAIQAATSVPARVMRLERETGTVEVGKRADLLILDANPLDNIANVRTGRFVVTGGVLYDCGQLWAAAGYAAARRATPDIVPGRR